MSANTGTHDVRSYPRFARAQMLASEEERKRIRANASLPKEAWIDIENAVYPAMDDVLTVVNDLRQMGLTTETSIYNKAVEWHKQDYTSEARVSMEPDARTDEGESEYDLDGSPLPVIHSDFSVGWRDSGSQGDMPGGMGGQDLETLNADGSARAVAEAAEQLVLNGWSPTISGEGGTTSGYTMYGLTNHPSAHTGTLSNWLTTPEDIRDNFKTLFRDLKDDNFRPGQNGYFVYIGEDLEDPLDQPDPEGTGDLLVRERVDNLPALGQIQVSEFLPNDAMLAFRPTPDVVDLAIALEEQVVQWEDPFRDNFKTIMAFTPRVKDTLRGQCGIAYYTGGTS